jgi:hypothetical protein
MITALPGTTVWIESPDGRTSALAIQAWDGEGFALVYDAAAGRLVRPSEIETLTPATYVGEAEPTRDTDTL